MHGFSKLKPYSLRQLLAQSIGNRMKLNRLVCININDHQFNKESTVNKRNTQWMTFAKSQKRYLVKSFCSQKLTILFTSIVLVGTLDLSNQGNLYACSNSRMIVINV